MICVTQVDYVTCTGRNNIKVRPVSVCPYLNYYNTADCNNGNRATRIIVKDIARKHALIVIHSVPVRTLSLINFYTCYRIAISPRVRISTCRLSVLYLNRASTSRSCYPKTKRCRKTCVPWRSFAKSTRCSGSFVNISPLVAHIDIDNYACSTSRLWSRTTNCERKVAERPRADTLYYQIIRTVCASSGKINVRVIR